MRVLIAAGFPFLPAAFVRLSPVSVSFVFVRFSPVSISPVSVELSPVTISPVSVELSPVSVNFVFVEFFPVSASFVFVRFSPVSVSPASVGLLTDSVRFVFVRFLTDLVNLVSAEASAAFRNTSSSMAEDTARAATRVTWGAYFGANAGFSKTDIYTDTPPGLCQLRPLRPLPRV